MSRNTRPEPDGGTTLHGCLSTIVVFAIQYRGPKKEMLTLYSKLGQKSTLQQAYTANR